MGRGIVIRSDYAIASSVTSDCHRAKKVRRLSDSDIRALGSDRSFASYYGQQTPLS
jgi:hypothetical protein